MNKSKKLTLALGLLAATAASHAQSTSPTPAPATGMTPTGLLGVRYTELAFGLQDIEHTSATGYAGTAKANTALVAGQLDGGASYTYSMIRGGGARGHANTIGGYLTAYAPLQGVKPFVTAGLGWQWSSLPNDLGDERAIWGGAVGAEIPAGAVKLTPRISYADDFRGTARSSQQWTYGVEANHWFNPTSAVFASVGWTEVRRSKFDAWTYVIGLRSRF